jgi:hypothetical protein
MKSKRKIEEAFERNAEIDESRIAPPNRGNLSSAHIYGTRVPGGGAVHSINCGLMHRSKSPSLNHFADIPTF